MEICHRLNLANYLAIRAINTYQKHLSPRKGYCCAHRILYDGDSCSEHIKKLFIDNLDLISVIKQSHQRFAACKQANIILKSQKEQPQKRKNQTQTKPESDTSYLGGEFISEAFCCTGEVLAESACEILECSDCGSLF